MHVGAASTVVGDIGRLGDVQSHCQRQLADFKKPRQIEIVAEIPRNAGGKVLKSALTQTQNQPE
jgi:acyl-CoA synthetase (AMP-forming)/AMP-acid ligase II